MTGRLHKIVFTGVAGAGKTTAIAALSDRPPVNTDVASTDPALPKTRTTVGLDFGEFVLDNGDRVRFFGTPGQERFDFLWHILARDALGIVILCDNARPDPLGDLCMYLTGFAESLKTVPCVVGVGRLETSPKPTLDDYAALLLQRGLVPPVLHVDVRRRVDVMLLLDLLLIQLEADLLSDGR